MVAVVVTVVRVVLVELVVVVTVRSHMYDVRLKSREGGNRIYEQSSSTILEKQDDKLLEQI